MVANSIFVLLSILLLSPQQSLGGAEQTAGADVCTSMEKWTFSGAVPKELSEKFLQLLKTEVKPSLSAEQAISFQKRVKKKSEARLFVQYWLARALYREGLVHLAADQFLIIFNESPKASTRNIQLASLECLNKIYDKYPRMHFSRSNQSHLRKYKWYFAKKPWNNLSHQRVLRAAVKIVLDESASKLYRLSRADVNSLLKNGGPYEALGKGVFNVMQKREESAIKHLESFFNFSNLDAGLEKQLDLAALTLGRLYYKRGQYKKSIEAFNRVPKASNYMVRSLVEGAQSAFMAGDVERALGTSLNFQKGSLKSLFAPEAPMIVAMVLNDRCQFPLALQAIKFFQRQYRKSYSWLRKDLKRATKKQNTNYHHEIEKYLEAKKSSVPVPILMEWVRSPLFLSHQSEVNLLIDEKELLRKNKKLLVKLKTSVKEQALKQRNYDNQLINRMNSDFLKRNSRMYETLKELRKLSKLIQIEIYSEASQDLVWSNANPEYGKFLDDMKKREKAEIAEDNLMWGPATLYGKGDSEIWEDELGTLKISTLDKCKSKDKYMDVVLKR